MLKDHIEKLEYFEAVARVGSIYRAAQLIGLSQSALSHSISVLEESLDSKLFDRSVKGVRLTEQGEMLLSFSSELFEKIKQVESEISDNQLEASKSIGTYDVFGRILLPKLLKSELGNKINLDVSIERSNDVLIQQLLEGKSDLAVMAEPPRKSGVNSKKIFTEYYSFYSTNRISKEISKHPLILFTQAIAGIDKRLDKIIYGIDLTPEKVIKIDSFETAHSFALDEVGVAILPTGVAEKSVNEGRLTRVKINGFPARFGSHDIFICSRAKTDELTRQLISEIQTILKK